MKTTQITYATLLLLVTATACEMTVDLDLPDQDPELVVNSYFGPGKDWEVDISSSSPIRTPGTGEVVENAEVTLYQEDAYVGKLSREDQVYRLESVSTPEPGRQYSLRVEAPGYESVEAFDVVPEPAYVELVSVIPEAREINGNNHTEVHIKITDDPDKDTFYYLTVGRVVDDPHGDEPRFSQTSYSSSDQAIAQYQEHFDFFETGGMTQYYGVVFFTDELFQGEDWTIVLYVPTYYTDPNYEDNLELHMRSISKSYFEYEISRASQSRTRDNPFAEPVTIRSNVSNGMGIFGAYNETVIPIE